MRFRGFQRVSVAFKRAPEGFRTIAKRFNEFRGVTRGFRRFKDLSREFQGASRLDARGFKAFQGI